MTAQQLVRLYPRAWRERYGDEFVETVGPKALHPQQVLDIIGGAIDARMSFRSKKAKAQTEGGGEVMVQQWKAICHDEFGPVHEARRVDFGRRPARRDVGDLGRGHIAGSQGYKELGDVLKGLVFPVSATISMPFAGHERSAQGRSDRVLGVTMAILLARRLDFDEDLTTS